MSNTTSPSPSKTPISTNKGDVPRERPNFGTSGRLAADTNTVNGVVVKYVEPSDRARPDLKWRLHVFKDKTQIDVLHLHRNPHYLIGRERKVADIPIDHPSCSKQHAVVQFREVSTKAAGLRAQKTIKPYLIDLESANGTLLNNEKIPSSRYIELRPKDVLQFGFSTREYILLHEEMLS